MIFKYTRDNIIFNLGSQKLPLIKGFVFTFGSTFHLFVGKIVCLLKGVDSEAHFPSIRRRSPGRTKHQGAPSSADPKNSMKGTSAALESKGTAGVH